MADSPIEGRGFTLEQLFNGHRFKLDFYQREYMWSREDVKSLVGDLYRRFATSWDVTHSRKRTSGYPPYFLGSFVYFQDENEGLTYLVDGQQRVTTLHLLLLHLRQLLAEQDTDHSDDLTELENLIRRVRHGERTYTIDIDERVPLLDSIYRGWPYELPASPTPSVRNLYERARDLRTDFPAELDDESILHFLDWLRDRVCLVGIRALNRDHGWEIFESMNDRGARLDPVDLLKSFLLSRAETDGDQLNKSWREMLAHLTSFHSRTPSDFIKSLLTAKYADLTQERRNDAADVNVIGRAAHEWVRANTRTMRLYAADDFRRFVEDEVTVLAERYATLMGASAAPHSGLEAVYYNAVNGIGSQYTAILATARRGETLSVFREKAGLVAAAIDVMYVRKFVNGGARQGTDLDPEIIHDLVPKLRACEDVDRLRALLGLEIGRLDDELRGITATKFGLRPGNTPQVRYLLARITAFVERECGRADRIADYLHPQHPHEIEHIWANKFERHQAETGNKTNFQAMRDRLGALLLLSKSDNASYQDDPYDRKVVYYRGQNILAASLHPESYEKDVGFRRFRKRRGLEKLFRHYPGGVGFTKQAIEERQVLYQRLCELVWDPSALGFPVPRGVDPERRVSHRTRAYYDVTVAQLIDSGTLSAGDELFGTNKRVRYSATVLAGGRIRVESGEVFTAPSTAAAFVLNRQSANGWTFWNVNTVDGKTDLKTLRAELLSSGRLELPSA
ncbi:DUF262 domain-containing protein [Nocardiopsis sediminis]|uniref:DUF262 domain-containing protein n=1 Tax=Nocardiopsis sediminis TaxID=1778267 RepID=A0ABV8FGE3_9ACTN